MRRHPLLLSILLPACLAATDPSSPKAAVESMTAGLASGDAAKIRAVLYATTDPERHMVDAMVAMSEAIARLRPVAAKRYGEDAARAVTGDPAATAADQRAKLDAAFEQIEGDVAHLTFPDPATDPITLRKIDAKWRIPVADKAADLSPTDLETRAADLAAAASAIDEVTALCQGGKWQTPNDVVIAIQEHVLKAQQARLPATQPATTTAPASRPIK